ncbi:MAG: hypothetical protein R3B09_04930 [Nannocystaceae bacterium]
MAATPTPTVNLRVHAGVVGALLLAYAALVGWAFQQPERPLDFTRLGALLAIIPIAGYVLVTTIALALVSRRRRAAAIVHAIGLTLGGALIAVGVVVDQGEEAVSPAQLARHAVGHADEVGRECPAIEAIRIGVTARGTLRGEVVVVNRCPWPIAVDDVDLVGFPPGGGNEFLSGERDARGILQPGGSMPVTVRSAFPVDRGAAVERWDYRVNATFVGSTWTSRCFTTAGAPATRGCGPIRPQAIARIEVMPADSEE